MHKETNCLRRQPLLTHSSGLHKTRHSQPKTPEVPRTTWQEHQYITYTDSKELNLVGGFQRHTSTGGLSMGTSRVVQKHLVSRGDDSLKGQKMRNPQSYNILRPVSLPTVAQASEEEVRQDCGGLRCPASCQGFGSGKNLLWTIFRHVSP